MRCEVILGSRGAQDKVDFEDLLMSSSSSIYNDGIMFGLKKVHNNNNNNKDKKK